MKIEGTAGEKVVCKQFPSNFVNKLGRGGFPSRQTTNSGIINR